MPQNVKKTKTPDQAYESLCRLCARAEKASGDALRLMRGWGLDETQGREVLDRLCRERFIDDSRYAAAFVREKMRFSGWGAYKIRSALAAKRIDKSIIDEALREFGPSDRESSAVRLGEQLARRLRTARHDDPRKVRAALMRYGLSLGYDYETVMESVDNVTRSIPDE